LARSIAAGGLAVSAAMSHPDTMRTPEHGRAPKKPTIDDVARLSGVARTTVSRVLNGGPNVRDPVRRKVLEAVKALDYRVNPQARSLAGGASGVLALILASDLDAEPNSFYASALELGAIRECLLAGFQLITRHVPQDDSAAVQQLLEIATSQRCQGVILTPPFCDNVDLIRQLRTRGVHLAAVSPGGDGRGLIDAVGIDDEAGGRDIARHLIDLGHRRLAYLSGIPGHLSAKSRLDGVRRAMREAGLDEAALVVEPGDFTFRSGGLIASRLLSLSPRPTALICANDDMATGALFAAHRMGLTLPADLSVVGFDDTPVSEVVWPPLTTIHQPIRQIGARAVEKLIDVLNGVESNGSGFEAVPTVWA
jgi:LacI family transcriptional regulator